MASPYFSLAFLMRDIFPEWQLAPSTAAGRNPRPLPDEMSEGSTSSLQRWVVFWAASLVTNRYTFFVWAYFYTQTWSRAVVNLLFLCYICRDQSLIKLYLRELNVFLHKVNIITGLTELGAICNIVQLLSTGFCEHTWKLVTFLLFVSFLLVKDNTHLELHNDHCFWS